MAVLQRILDRFLRDTAPFYDSLREDRFFLVSYLVGSYMVFQTVVNDLTGRYQLCSAGPGCQFPSAAVLLFGVLLLLLATLRRLIDLDCGRVGVEE